MNLCERYRRLSFWNKVSFWGAVSALIIFPPTIYELLFKVSVPISAPIQTINNAPNSINTIGQTGGKNVLVNNYGPMPSIVKSCTKRISLNIPDGDFYVSQYIIVIGNPPEGDKFGLSCGKLPVMWKGPAEKLGYANQFMAQGFTGPATTYKVTFVTQKKITEEQVDFSILPKT